MNTTNAEHTTSGVLVSPAFISTTKPSCLSVSGNDVFVGDEGYQISVPTIGEYTASRAAVNPTLFTVVAGANFGMAAVPEPPSSVAMASGSCLLPGQFYKKFKSLKC
jgi:hypothetical protein